MTTKKLLRRLRRVRIMLLGGYYAAERVLNTQGLGAGLLDATEESLDEVSRLIKRLRKQQAKELHAQEPGETVA